MGIIDGAMRTIGKGLKGAAAAGVPMLMEEHKAQIMAKRDEKLQSYNTANREADQTFKTSEREAGQEFTKGENDRNRALDNRKLDIEEDKTSKAIELLDAQISSEKLSLDEKKELSSIRTQIVNAETPEEMQNLADKYMAAQGKTYGDKYQATTLYGEENDYGVQSKASGILNTRTGVVQPAGTGGGGSGGSNQTQYEEGKIYVDSNGNKAKYVNGKFEPL